MTKIKVFITASDEQLMLIQAYRSALSAIGALPEFVNVTVSIVLDRPQKFTKTLANSLINDFTSISEYDFGNIGKIRNACIDLLESEDYCCFLDADDLFGKNWLKSALEISEQHDKCIVHPKYNFYFGSDGCFLTETVSSDSIQFDRNIFFDSNLWTSLAFTKTSIFRDFRYTEHDITKGLGHEDWAWNMLTLKNGIEHIVSPSSVHFIRRKYELSISRLGIAEDLQPLYSGFFKE